MAFDAIAIAGQSVEAVNAIDIARCAVEELGLLVREDDDSPHGDGEGVDDGVFKTALGLKFLLKAEPAGAEERRIFIGHRGESGAEAVLFRVLRDARLAEGGARSRTPLRVAAIGGDLSGCGHD
ncbi:MAG: hypothetical protein ACRD4P_02585 [Bryobacteraceae bacterium]